MIVIVAAGIGLVLTGVFVQLARRLGWGKAIREAGPRSHLGKAGTPTMGGVAFLVAAIAAWLLSAGDLAAELALVLLVVGSGALGLYDDVTSLRRKRQAASGEAQDGPDAATGVLARYRLVGQAVLGLAFAWWAVRGGAVAFGIGWLDVATFAFVIVGAINAFNFTDGLDGLAGGVGVIILLFFLGSPFAAALMGALLGFLWYNVHPARTFMGGVGSEALGAAVAGLAIVQGYVWYLPLIAILPVLEVLSVIAQVTYFRLTGGKRLLRMSPLHHHFELSGWPETRVVQRFYLVTALCVALAAALAGRLAVGP